MSNDIMEDPDFASGLIQAGQKCDCRDKCGQLKEIACNGNGCPFSKEDVVIDRNFSCAVWRLFRILGKSEGRNQTEESSHVS